jgi:hypothetical protein
MAGRGERIIMSRRREVSSLPVDPCHGSANSLGIKDGMWKHRPPFRRRTESSLRVNTSESGKVQHHTISRDARVAPEE